MNWDRGHERNIQGVSWRPICFSSHLSWLSICSMFSLGYKSLQSQLRLLHLNSLMLKKIPDILILKNCRIYVRMFVLINELTKDWGCVKKQLHLVQNTKSAKYCLHSVFLHFTFNIQVLCFYPKFIQFISTCRFPGWTHNPVFLIPFQSDTEKHSMGRVSVKCVSRAGRKRELVWGASGSFSGN